MSIIFFPFKIIVGIIYVDEYDTNNNSIGTLNLFKIFFCAGDQPTANCAHCRPGVPCDPFSGACMESKYYSKYH